jgi:DNA transposition AAA+ family ATPase
MKTTDKPLTFAAASVPREADESAPLALVTMDHKVVTADVHAKVLALLVPSELKGKPVPGLLRAADLAREAGVQEGYLSAYRKAQPGDRLGFDVATFETTVQSWLILRESNREIERQATSHFETPVSAGVADFIGEVETMQSVGVLTGDAGSGKSCALRMHYHQSGRRCVLVTADKWIASAAQLAGALHKALGMRGDEKRMEKMAAELKKSPRTLLIDNAHLLGKSALHLLIGLNKMNEGTDLPQCPVVLCGNPEIADKLRSNDQWSSHVSRVYNANLNLKDAPKVAGVVAKLISRYMAGEADNKELRAEAVRVARRQEGGRFRKVVRVLNLTRYLLTKENFRTTPAHEVFCKADALLQFQTEEAVA